MSIMYLSPVLTVSALLSFAAYRFKYTKNLIFFLVLSLLTFVVVLIILLWSIKPDEEFYPISIIMAFPLSLFIALLIFISLMSIFFAIRIFSIQLSPRFKIAGFISMLVLCFICCWILGYLLWTSFLRGYFVLKILPALT